MNNKLVDYVTKTAFDDISSDDYSNSSSSSSSEDDILQYHVPRIESYVEFVVPKYSDNEFRRHFRVTLESFQIIAGLLTDAFHTANDCGRPPISCEKGTLMFLWYMANKETFRQISDRFDVSESTAYSVINRKVNELVTKCDNYIKWPSKAEYESIAQGFAAKQQIIGAIDSTHIAIPRPKANQIDYCNRKNYHSVILQGIVNSKKIFTDVLCGEPGSFHDARVFRKSGIYAQVTEDPDFMGNYHLLGDSAYPRLLWLISPFWDNGHLSMAQRQFNYMHSATRIVIEHAFGLLKGMFRRITKFDNIHTDFIVKATIDLGEDLIEVVN